MTLRSFFIDFDSYFASVEQAIRPELQGRPVAVVPVDTETTCCIAASYQAKAYGVKTGTRVSEARRLCPSIVFVEARHEQYIHYHHRLVAAIDACIPVDAVLSIDEMRCSLTGSWQDETKALKVAEQVKQAVAKVGSMTCSIGIAPNTFLAKMASKLNKPDGVTVIHEHQLPYALTRLRLGELHGIGSRMQSRLNREGVHSVHDLYNVSRAEMRQIWGGIEGERLYDELRGKWVQRPEGTRSSIGHSHVLPPVLRRDDKALAVLHRLLQKAAWRLRHLGYDTGHLCLDLRYRGDGNWQTQEQFVPTQDTRALLRVLKKLWAQRPRGKTLLAVGVSLHKLIPAQYSTADLFDTTPNRQRLHQALDGLNRRFGGNTVYYGGAHNALNAAPMRIAFTQIPDPYLER